MATSKIAGCHFDFFLVFSAFGTQNLCHRDLELVLANGASALSGRCCVRAHTLCTGYRRPTLDITWLCLSKPMPFQRSFCQQKPHIFSNSFFQWSIFHCDLSDNPNSFFNYFFVGFEQSQLLEHKPDLAKRLKEWIPGRVVKLLFRASEHNFSAQAFHNLCDFRGSTVVVIKRRDSDDLFGGFSRMAWSSVNVWVPVSISNFWLRISPLFLRLLLLK